MPIDVLRTYGTYGHILPSRIKRKHCKDLADVWNRQAGLWN